nr:unnamed protein product [Callosobruchus analis]
MRSLYLNDVMKNARVKGLKCTSYKNKIKEAKHIGPNCRCLHKWFEKVDEESRNSIFKNFYGMTTKNEYIGYISTRVDRSKRSEQKKET